MLCLQNLCVRMKMMNQYLFFFFFLFLSANIPTSLSNDTTALSIATCLGENGVTNFTIFPQDHNYFSFLNFSIQNLRFAEPSLPKPTAIVLPESREQVVSTVACCRKVSLEIRIRSGGHSYEGTSSVATDGLPFLIIDLMNLDRVLSIDYQSRFAWVEAGATLGKTYYSISQSSNVHGFSAGSCPTVGIGGHISGGGFGLLSRKYGLAADNVLDAVLVDADGRVLNRESMGEDVFWAIRGGGGGVWGVILAWKIRLVEVPTTVTAFVVSRAGTKRYVATLVDKWQHVSPNLNDDLYLSVFVGAGLPGAAPAAGISATFKGFYLGTKPEMVSTLNRAFPELNISWEDCSEMRWIDSVVYFSGFSANIGTEKLKDRYLAEKLYFKAKSDYVRTPIPRRGIMRALEILERQAKGYVILDPYGGYMERVRWDSIPFPHRAGNLFSIQYMVEWKARSSSWEEEEYMEWIRGLYRSMSPYVSSAPRAAYINYMDVDLGVDDHLSDDVERARVWGEKYFMGNYDRLVRAKTIVDPLNMFRHQQGIPPAPSQYSQPSIIQSM